ncbi:MAG TPA: D-alanyl-D-alanine carboxypeptidase/D-alanyl-D-alanine-endopeptidase [Gemmatimonadaceae bacterium]|nr:D-alanyl-D-alanine carboxypeptidase/D-alanyl-D-alanine-endopeptidase [Gemmatimonadaceae bacterium]
MKVCRTPAVVAGLVALGCASGGTHPSPAPQPAALPASQMATSAAPPSPLEVLRTGIDSMIADSVFRNANWGILIVDPDGGDTLYSHNAGKLFMPASNMKVITGSVALAQLGPNFQFRTTFVADGPVCDGTLHGDLVVDGRGDPSESDAMRGDALSAMRDIADSLRARGIDRVAGQVLSGFDAFPGPTLGYGWSWDDLDASYSAGVDELFFNEGAARMVIRGGRKPGSKVSVAVLPTPRYPTVRVAALTAFPPESLASGSGGRHRFSRLDGELHTSLDTLTGTVVLTGWIAPDVVDTMDVVYPDQNTAYLEALRGALIERGVVLRNVKERKGFGGCGAHRARAAPPMADTLFTYLSPPLRDVLRAMAKPSQNQIAEILLRTIGLERAGSGTADSGIAVVRRQLLAWGVQPDGFVQRDGSGLSRYDYLTPETLVRVLASIRKDTAFSAFYDALPIAGVDGTIGNRMRGTPAQGNVHAKTGFVANARSLSGYVTTADGHMLIFSALCNNWTTSVREIERVQDAIAVDLASMRLGGGTP